MADKDAERFEPGYYVDLEMNIPAKVGDTVAVMVPANLVPPNRWALEFATTQGRSFTEAELREASELAKAHGFDGCDDGMKL